LPLDASAEAIFHSTYTLSQYTSRRMVPRCERRGDIPFHEPSLVVLCRFCCRFCVNGRSRRLAGFCSFRRIGIYGVLTYHPAPARDRDPRGMLDAGLLLGVAGSVAPRSASTRQGAKVLARQRYLLCAAGSEAICDGSASAHGGCVPGRVRRCRYRFAGDDFAGRAPNTIRVELRIDPADLLLRVNAGQYSAPITLLYSARAASGPQGEPTLAEMDLRLTREQRDAAMKEGIAISKEYPIDSATQKVRLIVLDRAADSVGSLTAPVVR
jgi:hypothetical protein